MNILEAQAHMWAKRHNKIRPSSWPEGEWVQVDGHNQVSDHDGIPVDMNNHTDGEGWEIFKEPTKYSVDIWLQGEPRASNNMANLVQRLFGGGPWSGAKGVGSKRYKITVEEVPD